MAVGFVAALLIVSSFCGPPGPMEVGEPASFTDGGATQSSGYEGTEPKLEVEKIGDIWALTAFQGRQPTNGYDIRVERAIHVGTGVRIRARFTTPKSSTSLSGVRTSPAHTVRFRFGADAYYLYDQDDRKRAELIRP